MKSITFMFPGGAAYPTGGIKVVFEYANRLVADGYTVYMMMPMSRLFWESPLSEKLKVVPRYLYNLITHKYRPYKWFNLDKRVKLCMTPSLSQVFAPKSDIYVATAVQTAIYLNRYNIPNKNKYYFIQDYENWQFSDERLIETYKFDIQQICISDWLAKILVKEGGKPTILHNGFDFTKFCQSIDIRNKDKYSITLMSHPSTRKGCQYSYKTLDIVKQKYPQLKVVMFGAEDHVGEMPDWYEFHKMPSAELHNSIYNQSAIYMASSLIEGWGLTVGEAMICGAAIVCTDTDGFKEMIVDKENGLLSPIKDPEAMAANIIKLIENDELRYRLAQAGYESIQRFTWDNSYNKLKALFN